MKNEKKILSAIVVSLMLASCGGDDKADDKTAATPASTVKKIAQMNVYSAAAPLTAAADINFAEISKGLRSASSTEIDATKGLVGFAASFESDLSKLDAVAADKITAVDEKTVNAEMIAKSIFAYGEHATLKTTQVVADATKEQAIGGLILTKAKVEVTGAVDATDPKNTTSFSIGFLNAKGAELKSKVGGALNIDTAVLIDTKITKEGAATVAFAKAATQIDNLTTQTVIIGKGSSVDTAVVPAGHTVTLNSQGIGSIDTVIDNDPAVKTAKADGVTAAALPETTDKEKEDKAKQVKAAETALADAKAVVTRTQKRLVAGTLSAADLTVNGKLTVAYQNAALSGKKITVGSVKDDVAKTVDAAGEAILNDGVWGDLTVVNGKATLSGKDTEAAVVKVGKDGTFTFDAKKAGNVELGENATFVCTGQFDGKAGNVELGENATFVYTGQFDAIAGDVTFKEADKANSFDLTSGKTLTIGALSMNKFSKTKINISDAGMVTKGIDAPAFVSAYTPVFADEVAKRALDVAIAELAKAREADKTSTDATKAALKKATDDHTAANDAKTKTAGALTADTNKLQAAYDAVKASTLVAAAVDGSVIAKSAAELKMDGTVSLVLANKKKIAAGSIIKILHSDVKLTPSTDLKILSDSIKLADSVADLTKANATVLLDKTIADSKDLFLIVLADIAAAPAAPAPANFIGAVNGNIAQALTGNTSSFATTMMGSVSVVSASEGQTGQFVGFNFGGFGVYASYETSTNAINAAAAAYKTSFGGFDFSGNATYAVNKATIGDLNVDSKTFASNFAMGLPVKALGATFTPSAFAGYGMIASNNSTLVSGDSFNAGTSAGFAGAAFKATTDFSFKSVAFKAFANFSAASEFAARGNETAVAPTQSSAMFGLNAAVDSSTSLSAQAGLVKNNNLDAQSKFELAMNIKL